MIEEYSDEQLYIEKHLEKWPLDLQNNDIKFIEEQLESKLCLPVIINVSESGFLVRLFKADGIKRYIIGR